MISLSFLFASYILYVELRQTVIQKYQHVQRKRAHKRLSSFLRGPGKTEKLQEITILFQSNTNEGGRERNCDQNAHPHQKKPKEKPRVTLSRLYKQVSWYLCQGDIRDDQWKLDFESFCLVTSTAPMKYQMRLHEKPEFQYPPNTDKGPQFISARVASEEA